MNIKSGEIDDDVIQALQSDLVRAEKRGGATWYELTHDRLVEPILGRNKLWFDENLSPLQRQAALWNDQGRNETWLFSDQALVQAEGWAKEHQDEFTQIEKEFLKECQTKQKEKEQRQELKTQQQKLIAEQKQARQRRITTYISIAVTVVMCMLAVLAIVQSGNAFLQTNQAKSAQATAVSNEHIASTQQAIAVANLLEAEKQTLLARVRLSRNNQMLCKIRIFNSRCYWESKHIKVLKMFSHLALY